MNRALCLALALLLASPLAAAQFRAPTLQTPTVAQSLARIAELQGIPVLDAKQPHAGTLRAEILSLYSLVGARPTALGLAKLDAALAGVPASIQAPTADVLAAMNAASRLRAQAFAKIGVDDARWAYARGLDPTPMSAADASRASDVISRIDVAKMNEAARIVAAAVEAATPRLARAAMPAVSFLDPLGAVEIAPTTDDVHAVDRTLLIDLGGNDDWQNNAGATKPDYVIDAFPGCITTGGLDCTALDARRNGDATRDVFGRPCRAGGDTAAFALLGDEAEAGAFVVGESNAPSTPDARAYALHAATYPQGAQDALALDASCVPQGPNDTSTFLTKGTLVQGDEHNVAVGIDVSGDDRYAPPREFNDINNGNNAAGCDTRGMGEAGKLWARNLTAGGAFAGIGVLWDASGSDTYGGRSIVQGAGHVGGVGVLVDDGPGDNTFSAVRLGQGLGFFAGVGLLDVRGGGNDRYAMENDVPYFNEFEHFIGCDVSTRDGQGRGNFNGAGALLDAGGDDAYVVQSHDATVPGSVRDDVTTTEGSGGDRLQIIGPPFDQVFGAAIGILDDEAGHDAYARADRSDGGQATGVGIFHDSG